MQQAANVLKKPVSDPPLAAEGFFADMATTLAGTLEETVGLEDAASFVARVGFALGNKISEGYAAPEGGLPDDLPGIAAILVDLKAQIGGQFAVESIGQDEIVLVNAHCPFGERVQGRPSLCMMTTNVFGRIVSNATGYACVEIEQAIATGSKGCRVVVHLSRPANDAGHEFFG